MLFGRLATLAGLVWFIQTVPAQGPPRLEVEFFDVTPTAIQPAQITRPPGPFVLVIQNHSDLKTLVVHLKSHGNGNDLRQADLDNVGGNYGGYIDVPSGQYDLTVPAHPELHATITILN